MKFVCLFVLALIAQTASKQRDHYCGKKLVKTLEILCKQTYHSLARKERDIRPVSYNELKTRMRRDLISECCKKSCSISTLRLYCHPSENTGEEVIEKNSKKSIEIGSHLSSNSIPRDDHKMQGDEPPREIIKTTMQPADEEKDVTNEIFFGYHKYEGLGKPRFVWSSEFYDDNSRLKYNKNRLTQYGFSDFT